MWVDLQYFRNDRNKSVSMKHIMRMGQESSTLHDDFEGSFHIQDQITTLIRCLPSRRCILHVGSHLKLLNSKFTVPHLLHFGKKSKKRLILDLPMV